MKILNKNTIILMMVAFIISGIVSCKKDSTSGEPEIKYIRLTNPDLSDSLLIGAKQGRLIAIVGENLQGAKEIWFNDQQALLTPTFITNTSILVSVPLPVPVEITNTIRIVFANGRTIDYNFQVQINAPTVTSMNCEYVNAGDVASISGDYFYPPLTVTFSGGAKGEIVSVTDQLIQVRVPGGAEPGQITVATNFGSTKSNFWFRDNRNIYISNDPFAGWWGAAYIVSDPGPGAPSKINGNYVRYINPAATGTIGVLGGPASAMPDSKNIPDDAILNPAGYYLKFEINTQKPYNAKVIRLNVALADNYNNAYLWKPPFDTHGQWQTVVIPFEKVMNSYGGAMLTTPNPNGYWNSVAIQGSGTLDADISFDNFRVVPKVSK